MQRLIRYLLKLIICRMSNVLHFLHTYLKFLWIKKNIRKNISPIDRFFATVDESDSDKMLEAVQDCRRIEPYEW